MNSVLVATCRLSHSRSDASVARTVPTLSPRTKFYTIPESFISQNYEGPSSLDGPDTRPHHTPYRDTTCIPIHNRDKVLRLRLYLAKLEVVFANGGASQLV
ncbi:unnamed protein product [Pieris brassicae]|uniref:Uncharacterized protein n=1 Tax=Pieris brassicae TaxID=7116 RepID=A0A9P0TUJ0_PIEBR|nr:unnamed protein product [Pieris brassicae]